jgi:hypothetical protein
MKYYKDKDDKGRFTENCARETVKEFYESGDLHDLIWEISDRSRQFGRYNFHCRELFVEKVISELKKNSCRLNCDKCKHRFKCYTGERAIIVAQGGKYDELQD